MSKWRHNTNSLASRMFSMVRRATVREFDDNHLGGQVKSADKGFSQTPTDFENFQNVGMRVFPVKQKKDDTKSQNQQQSQQGGDGDWNYNQPRGESAECIMLNVGSNEDHPVCIATMDRRVEPYDMEEGDGAFYDPAGSGQMALHKETGFFILSCNEPDIREKEEQQQQQGGGGSQQQGGSQQEQKKPRVVSIRHVVKPKQDRKPKQKKQSSGASALSADATQEEKYKHEGQSVNTEMRVSENHIEFFAGDEKIAYYDRGSKRWNLHTPGDKKKSVMAHSDHSHIRHKDFRIWVDKDGCWSTVPIQIKQDEHDDD